MSLFVCLSLCSNTHSPSVCRSVSRSPLSSHRPFLLIVRMLACPWSLLSFRGYTSCSFPEEYFEASFISSFSLCMYPLDISLCRSVKGKAENQTKGRRLELSFYSGDKSHRKSLLCRLFWISA